VVFEPVDVPHADDAGLKNHSGPNPRLERVGLGAENPVYASQGPALMGAWYNENDPAAAEWLRELIRAGLIAPGEVDERSIVDVGPGDIRGFTQCHFFAGIGVWSYALRQAGWPDDTPVWTGSCPCQPFSAAGRRRGGTDERHLWPAWFRLIRELRPQHVFGEQVASKDGLAWFDVVSTDLEGAGYAVGACDTCAAGFGAPHIRQRLYFVADAASSRCGAGRAAKEGDGRNASWVKSSGLCSAGRVADSPEPRQQGSRQHGSGPPPLSARSEQHGIVGDPLGAGLEEWKRQPEDSGQERETVERNSEACNGFWADAEWLPCRDGKYRPVKPGISPLAARTAGRVGLLRGYGNALCAPQAQAFIEAFLEG
jgi:DNA (cytosine-5)-methyltransferase 1